MTAEQILECLSRRWPDSEYLSIDEAPLQADRGGRKLDRLVVSLWKSRGLQLDGIEVKISRGDLKKELAAPAKADGWYRHVHRFWLAVPEALAQDVISEAPVAGTPLSLPPTWGLLACAPGESPRVAVKPDTHDAAPFDWDATIGLLRASADAGVQAIWRAEQRGRDQAYESAKREFERRDPDQTAARLLADLRASVDAFEKASGLSITNRWPGDERAVHAGRMAALVQRECSEPGYTLNAVGRAVESLRRLHGEANEIEKFALTVERICASQPEQPARSA